MTPRKKLLLLCAVPLSGLALAIWLRRTAPETSATPSNSRQQAAPVKAPSAATPAVDGSPPPQPSSTPVPAQPNFRSLDVLERNAILKEIGKQDLPTMFQLWLGAGRVENDLMKQGAIATTMAYALRNTMPTPEFLDQMRLFVADNSTSRSERSSILGIFGFAATKEGVDFLIWAATTLEGGESKGSAFSAFDAVGQKWGDGNAHEERSPALERVWRESRDPQLLAYTAQAMAAIGAPAAIEQLLSAALTTDGSDKARLDAAQRALQEVYLSNAVPPLAARLANQPPTSAAAKLSAPILVRIGDATAGKTVVTWLQGIGEDAAPLIRDLVVQQTRTPAMFTAWKAALDPTMPFRNEQNREAIRAGLAVRKP